MVMAVVAGSVYGGDYFLFFFSFFENPNARNVGIDS